MMISLITAWIAAICVIFTAFKFFAKKNKTMNRIFQHIHIPMGVLLIAAGLVHGLLAGNPLGTTLNRASIGEVLFTWNMGTVCFILSILLGITYILRKVLKKNWMRLHRLLTVMLAAGLVVHIYQVGISIPYAIFDSGKWVQGSENIDQADIPSIIDETETKSVTEETESKAGIEETESKSVKEETETPQYFERAKEMISSILNGQSLEVDGISGATYSSKGIQNAVYNALQEAVVSGELKISDIQIMGGHGKGKFHK